jgi:hypothetical protein
MKSGAKCGARGGSVLPHSLSELGIKSLPVKDKSYKVYDGEGLYLEVYPGGSKLWRYRWKMEFIS